MQLLKRLLAALALLPIAHAAHAGPFLYVPTHKELSGVDVLSAFDTATDTRTGEAVVRGADSGSLVVRGVAFSPDGTRIYAASPTAVTVINAADNQVVAQIDLNGITGTRALLMNPAGTLLYVRTSTGLRVIDTVTNTVAGAASDLFDAANDSAAFNPAGTRLYRVNGSGNQMETVDTASHAIVATTTVGDGNRDIAVNPAGTRVYVLNSLFPAFSVSVIDTTNFNSVIATIPVGAFPVRLLINPAGSRVYVSLLQELTSVQGYVSVIDTATNTLTATIPAGNQVVSMAINPTGTRLYVQSKVADGENVIGVIDTACNGVLGTISQAAIGGFFQELYMAPAAGVVGPPADAEHVQITGVEVTQGIQDLANSVMLIGGRRTFVRVYVKSDGPKVPGVTAILSGVGNIFCNPGTCPPSGSSLVPLVPVNAVGTRITVGPSPKRYNVDDSFLFELPWEWTNYQSLHLHAVVSQGPGLLPTQSCRSDVLNAPLYEFERGFETLKIQFIRLSYRLPGTFNGVTEGLHETSFTEQQQSESFIRRTYPLSELLPAPDYPMFDGGLGFAVARDPFLCVISPANDQSLCARDYIANQLAALQARTGFMGDADAIYGLIPQVPNDKGVFFTRGSCCTSVVGAGPSDAPDYAAHEIGHFLGRQHPVEGAARCEHSASDPDYPYFGALIATPFADTANGLAGFDGGDASLLIPRSMFPTLIVGPGTEGHYDVMSYCKPGWISDYTYNKLHICLGALHGLPGVTPGCGQAGQQRGPGTAQQGDWLAVFGSISTAGAADFIARRADRNYSPPRSASGTHSIRLIGAGGATLADYPFTPDEVADAAAPGSSAEPGSFGQVVPFIAGTQEVQIVDATAGSAVIGEKTVSANAPAVSDVALQGVPDPITGHVTLAWTASDADGDSLSYDIFFTRDLGATLQPLLLGISQKSAQVDTTSLAGGSAQLRVVATDGVQSAFADTSVFTLTNKPPKPRILSPADGAIIHVGQLINIEGTATDPQDGVIAASSLAWSIPGRSLGSGSRLSITDLPAGLNQITLTATNSVGLSATATASVNVKVNVDLPGPTLTAGPMQIGWHLGTGESDLQTAPLQVGNSGGGSLEFTAESSAPWLTLSSTTGTAPAIITLTADPTGFEGGTTTDATVTLTSAGSPSQVIQIPVTLSVGNTFVVARTPGTVVRPPPAADFAITASIATGSIAAGESVETALTVSPSNGMHGDVSLSCSGLPASATCSFSPASLMVDGAPATSTLTIGTAMRTAMNSHDSPFNPLAPGGVILAAIGVPAMFRRRRILAGARHFALLALLFIGAFALHGCGGGGEHATGNPGGGNPGGGSTGTPAGTYNVTITATSGSTTHAVTYALTVT